MRHLPVVIEIPCSAALLEIAARAVELVEQRLPAIEPIQRHVRAEVGRAHQLKAAIRGDANVRLAILPALILQRLDDGPIGPAAELGPELVVGIAEKGAVRTRTRHFADAM